MQTAVVVTCPVGSASWPALPQGSALPVGIHSAGTKVGEHDRTQRGHMTFIIRSHAIAVMFVIHTNDQILSWYHNSLMDVHMTYSQSVT